MPHVLDSLLSAFRETDACLPDRRDGRNKRYEVSDAAGCAPACFFTQCESFLAFQRRTERDGSRSNCRTLFGAGRIPCDNRIRNLLDDLDPAALDPLFRPWPRNRGRAGRARALPAPRRAPAGGSGRRPVPPLRHGALPAVLGAARR